MSDVFSQLETHRRQSDLSYQQLAARIANATGRYRNQDCWRKLCQGLTTNPQATTVDIAEAYLQSLPKGRRRKPAKAA